MIKNTVCSQAIKLLEGIQLKLVSVAREEPKPRISSPPFISGDLFMAYSDVALTHAHPYPLVLRRNKHDVLFVESELIELPATLCYAKQFKAVILHNGDYVTTKSVIEKLTRSGLSIFGTNLNDNNLDKVFTLPIGIENAHHRRNGSIHYYNPLSLAKTDLRKDIDILTSFSLTTNRVERTRIERKLRKAGHSNQKFSVCEYRRRLARANYVISPPGNGIDCHRTWEAFYHKSIPVVEKRHWLFERHELPVLVVDEIDEFIAMSDAVRSRRYSEIIDGKFYPAIYFDYWLDFIKKNIN